MPSGFVTIQCFRVTACFQSFFFCLCQTYQVACPRPHLSSVKQIMCFLSNLNEAHSTVCHHPVFHVGDKVQILPHALWVIHTLLFITCFSFLTCFKCFLPLLGQTHQQFSNIQCFSTVTYFKNFATHHRSEVPNSLSAFHASVRGLASSASSQPETKHTQ